MKNISSAFYKNLPAIKNFRDFFELGNRVAVPDDWYVVITDVVESTRAIEEGRYKDVNIAGGLVVMAISNEFKDLEFPYLFGGDGATCLIPPSIAEKVRDVIYDTRLKVKAYFDLDLRVGMVPIRELYEKGEDLCLAKIKVSPFYIQAIMSGSAIDTAEQWVKQAGTANPYLITEKMQEQVEADFTGFTCRWQDIPSRNGETIATIIKINTIENSNEIITCILDKMKMLFGDEVDYHPIMAAQLKLAQSGKYLGKEARVFAKEKKGWNYRKNLMRIKMEAGVTNIAMRFNLNVKSNWYELNRLREYQTISSDYKKFDGSLKMVISCTTAARQEWEQFLSELHQKAMIYYGVHVSDRALMTCLLHSESEKEVHFIDAADGGYALAAKQLKKQIAATVS